MRTCFGKSLAALSISSLVDNFAVPQFSPAPLHSSKPGHEPEAGDTPALAVLCSLDPVAPVHLVLPAYRLVRSAMVHNFRSPACNPLAVATANDHTVRTVHTALVRLSHTAVFANTPCQKR